MLASCCSIYGRAAFWTSIPIISIHLLQLSDGLEATTPDALYLTQSNNWTPSRQRSGVHEVGRDILSERNSAPLFWPSWRFLVRTHWRRCQLFVHASQSPIQHLLFRSSRPCIHVWCRVRTTRWRYWYYGNQ